MDLSVVVTTLNGRDSLEGCLAALSERVAPEELIVVNGPSADGTTGMVRDRGDVDVLLELADRSGSVARNAGIDAATGDAIAFVDEGTIVTDGWIDAVGRALAAGADAVTGPARRSDREDSSSAGPKRVRYGDRTVTQLSPGNVALTRAAIERLDGFDEYLPVGGRRDTAHRIAGLGLRLDWQRQAAVGREGTAGPRPLDWRWVYRSIAYTLAKNYGVAPGTMLRILGRAVADGRSALATVLEGDLRPSRWLGNGRDVASGGVRGVIDGLVARRRGGPTRNPRGLSSRSDRAVQVYDRR